MKSIVHFKNKRYNITNKANSKGPQDGRTTAASGFQVTGACVLKAAMPSHMTEAHGQQPLNSVPMKATNPQSMPFLRASDKCIELNPLAIARLQIGMRKRAFQALD